MSEPRKYNDVSDLSSGWRKLSVVSTFEFIEPLITAGIIPTNCSRFILDCKAGGVVEIYVSTFPTGKQCAGLVNGLVDLIRQQDADHQKWEAAALTGNTE